MMKKTALFAAVVILVAGAFTFLTGCDMEIDSPYLEAIQERIAEDVEEAAGSPPEIDLSYNNESIESGSSVILGGVVTNTPKDFIFMIENAGEGNLNFYGEQNVEISGIDEHSFFLLSPPSSPILPGGSSTFTIRVEAASTGIKTVSVSIQNNDKDEGEYIITLIANAIADDEPDISINDGTTNITSDEEYIIEDTEVGENKDIMFTIENIGTLQLNLTGNPPITLDGGDINQFTIIEQPDASIIPYTTPPSSQDFTIRFSPDTLGLKSTTVVIPNNDPQEEPEFRFTIQGEGKNIPEVSTASVINIGPTSAECGGNVTNEGGDINNTVRGVC